MPKKQYDGREIYSEREDPEPAKVPSDYIAIRRCTRNTTVVLANLHTRALND
jgi:hypothetical protein